MITASSPVILSASGPSPCMVQMDCAPYLVLVYMTVGGHRLYFDTDRFQFMCY